MAINWEQTLAHLWLPVVEVLAGLLVAPHLRRYILRMAKKAPDKGIITFLASAASISLVAFSVLLAAEQLGFRMTGTLGLLSAIGLGMTLALKDNMSNVAGGIQILLTRPFVVGDYIQANGHQGTVSSVELMYTTITTCNDKEVIIPNSILVSERIMNWSRHPSMRLVIHFHVHMPADVNLILDQAKQIAASSPYLTEHPDPDAWCTALHKTYASLAVSVSTTGDRAKKARRQILTELATKLPAFQPGAPKHYTEKKSCLERTEESEVTMTDAITTVKHEPAENPGSSEDHQ